MTRHYRKNEVIHPFPRWSGFTAYSPTLPQFYENTYSQEQTIKTICKEINKMIRFLNCIIDTLNHNYEEYLELLEKCEELLERVEKLIIEIKELEERLLKEWSEFQAEIRKEMADFKQEIRQAFRELERRIEIWFQELEKDLRNYIHEEIERIKKELEEWVKVWIQEWVEEQCKPGGFIYELIVEKVEELFADIVYASDEEIDALFDDWQ